jgi:hypothetical protein
MSAGWFLVALALAFWFGWVLCSYWEEQARIEERRKDDDA